MRPQTGLPARLRPVTLAWPVQRQLTLLDKASARCAATANMPVQRWPAACRAAARSHAPALWKRRGGGESPPFRCQSARPHRPPAPPVDTYGRPTAPGMWLHVSGVLRPPPPCPARGPHTPALCPSWPTGLTKVVSTGAWAPCHSGRPFASTSMRREPASGTSTFTLRRKTLVATRAPPSRQTLAASRSTGAPCGPNTPAVGHAALWSPKASNVPPQRHLVVHGKITSFGLQLVHLNKMHPEFRSAWGPSKWDICRSYFYYPDIIVSWQGLCLGCLSTGVRGLQSEARLG